MIAIAIGGCVSTKQKSIKQKSNVTEPIDWALHSLAKQKAKELGKKPIAISKNSQGVMEIIMSWTKMEGGKVVFQDGDMLYNIGNRDIEILNVILKKGDYCILSDSICKKINNNLLN